MHDQNRAAVRGDGHFGIGIELSIVFIAVVVSPGQRRSGTGDNLRADGTGRFAAVIVDKRCGVGGIIVFLHHVHDRIADGPARPLGIQGGIPLDGKRTGHTLRQFRVRIPACKIIAIPGGHGAGKGDGAAIELRAAAHIGAAVRLIGDGEVFAGIINLEFLACLLLDGGALGTFQHRIIEVLDDRVHKRSQNAFDMLPGICDLRIAAALQILQEIDIIVFRRVFDILDLDLAFPIRIELILLYDDRGLGRIIDRRAADILFLGLGAGGGNQGIGEIILFNGDQFPVIDEPFSIVFLIPVFRFKLIDRDLTEHRDRVKIGLHDGFRRHFFGLGPLDDPAQEGLSADERILGHDADLLAGLGEILGRMYDRFSVFVGVQEADLDALFELRGDGEVGGDLLHAGILSLAHEPALEGVAFNDGIRGQIKGIPGEVGILRILFPIHHEDHGEDILGIERPYGGIRRDPHRIAEVILIRAVDPLAGIAGFGRNGGDIVQAVAGAGIDGPGSKNGFLIFLIESDGPGDLRVIRNHGRIRFGYESLVDPGTENIVS